MYSIIIERNALKSLSGIPDKDAKKIENAINELGEDPRPMGYIQLKGRSGYRIRVGNYRIIYEINDDELLVLVVEIGDRKEIYKKK